MRVILFAALLASMNCSAQEWQADVMIGGAGYNGDLTKRTITFQTIRPAIGVNFKYDMLSRFVIRAGVSYMQVAGDDKYNKQEDLASRNLNFRTNIIEASVCAEFNLFEPDFFNAYPYLFAGLGAFHFNPYSKDNSNKKTFLRPLSTEGQGLAAFPDRKKYSLLQICVPFGAGWKMKVSDKLDLAYELGFRYLFTDYLDDVSKSYVDQELLLIEKGPKSVEMAYRAKPMPSNGFLPANGDIRGNPKVKDWYFVNGIKLIYHFGEAY